MPPRFNIKLGGISISLISNQLRGEYTLVKRAIDFQGNGKSEILIKVHCGDFPALEGMQVAFDTVIAWKLLRVGEKWAIQVNSPQTHPYQLGIFSQDFRSGDIYVAQNKDHPDQFVFPLSYPMGELYLMNLLGTGSGMLFHAAGVIDQGTGYLFAGQGGAGKTTTAKLWQEKSQAYAVSDDKVIVRKVSGGYRLYGTPWPGEGGMALPDSAIIKKIFLLKKSDHNEARQLKPAQAASQILARAFVPLWDAEKIAFSLNFLDKLCQSIPCYVLEFLPDHSAVDFVRNLFP